MRLGVVSSDHQENPNEPGTFIWGGSGWARVGQYLPALAKDHEIVLGTLVWDMDRFKVQTGINQLEDVDGVFMHRLMHKGLSTHTKLARKRGQIIINDLDDWYWGLDPSNNAFHASHPKFNDKEDRYSYQSTLGASDLLIVSTPYLAQRIAERVQTRVELVENTVDVSRFTPVELHDGTYPTVGWVGSTAHRSGDLETMRGILGPLQRDGVISLMHGGAHPSASSFASAIGVSDECVSYTLPLKSHAEYPTLMQMDVGIVPLRVTPFNRAKSGIKGLEYAAAGVPFIAQSIDAYDDLRYQYGIGVVCKRPSDWTKALRRMCDPVYRNDLSVMNRELVWKRNISVEEPTMRELIGSLVYA